MTRLTPDRIAEIKRRWALGESAQQIGRMVGCKADTVFFHARRLNLAERPKKPGKPSDSRWTPENIEKAFDLYITKGLSAHEAAEGMGEDYTRRMIIGLAYRNGWKKENFSKFTPKSVRVPKPPRPPKEKRIRIRKRQEVVMLPVPVELRKRPWTALEGSNPVSLFHRCGCKWPIDGETEQLFCDLPIHEDNANGWCERHIAMGLDFSRPKSRPSDLLRMARRAA